MQKGIAFPVAVIDFLCRQRPAKLNDQIQRNLLFDVDHVDAAT
jgi:hypothetical protein